MKLNRKVTNFIRLEEGNIGRKSVVVTGALLASGVLATVLISIVPPAEGYYDHCNEHTDSPHVNHSQAHLDYHENCGWGCPCD